MRRKYALAVGAMVAVTAAFVSGAKPPANEKKPAGEHKTAVFNMAAVMRDFHQAKYKVWLLNNKKTKMSKDIVAWREEYIQQQQDLQKSPNHPNKDEKTKRMLTLARKIEDADRDINKELNDDASAIIADLYDMMKAEVDRVAKQEGFKLVLAYPDATTAEELKSPYIKELKLKPPAAQPFYVAADIDITARVVAALNEKYPAIDADTKKPVDVSKLDVPLPVPTTPNPPPPFTSPAPAPRP